MLCCTSAPPTTRMERSPENTGQASGATKQMRGRRAGPAGTRPPVASASSGGLSADLCTNVFPVDALQLERRLVDAAVGIDPLPLSRGDVLATLMGPANRSG